MAANVFYCHDKLQNVHVQNRRFSVAFYLQDHVTEQNKWISYLKIT